MKKFVLLLAALCVILSGSAIGANLRNPKETLFQTSTINALLNGVYDGDTTFKQLAKYGNFGIGTFNHLDGEMVGVDGKFYQIKTDGKAYRVSDSMKTPFAAVTSFEADKVADLTSPMDFNALTKYIETLFPTRNYFYAIRIDGEFSYLKARSVPSQVRPYRKLAEIVKNQTTFEFNNVSGTIVGLWCPGFAEGVNVPGYHLHFITKDRTAGGHILDLQIKSGKLSIDYTPDFYMVLPNTTDFKNVNLEKNQSQDLNKVEK